MFGFNSWSDFTNKAAESLSQASESAKTGLQNVSNKTKELAASFPDNAKTKLSNLQANVTTFVQDQRQQYKQVEHETELKKRRKERRAKLLKHGIPPWHVFEEDLDANDILNTSNEDDTNEKKIDKKNCTFEELRLLILKLCEDENTFLVEAPSSSSVFSFHMETALPYANAALNYDPILPRIRYKLVPKRVSETQFWKNYFYRVQLIRESMGYPKLDLSANAPSMDELRRQVINNTNSNESSDTNTIDNNNENNDNINENESKSDNTLTTQTTQSIFEQKTDEINENKNDNNIDNKSQSITNTNKRSQNSPRDLNENNQNDINNDETNNSLLSSVVSLDGSESSIVSNENSIVKVNKPLNIDNNDSNTTNNNVNHDEDEDDDYMASNDLHIDALTPEARARMTKELGLKRNEQNGIEGNNTNNSNISNSNNSNETNDADTEDVDALLANVDVDGASDISDDELAKVMSEVENT